MRLNGLWRSLLSVPASGPPIYVPGSDAALTHFYDVTSANGVYLDTGLTSASLNAGDLVRGIRDLSGVGTPDHLTLQSGNPATVESIAFPKGLYMGRQAAGGYFSKTSLNKTINFQSFTFSIAFTMPNFNYTAEAQLEFFHSGDGRMIRLLSMPPGGLAGTPPGSFQLTQYDGTLPGYHPYQVVSPGTWFDPSIIHTLTLIGDATKLRVRLDGVVTDLPTCAASGINQFNINKESSGSLEMRWIKAAIRNTAATTAQAESMEFTFKQGFTGNVYSPSIPAAVCPGNSLTFATSSTTPSTDNYPSKLFGAMTNLQVANYGTQGYGLTDLHNRFPHQEYKLLRPGDALCVWDITNDTVGGQSRAAQVARHASIASEVTARGAKLLILDCMDRGNFTGGQRTIAFGVNSDLAALYTTPTADPLTFKNAAGTVGLLKLSASTRFGGVSPWVANGTYWDADQIHLTTLGYGTGQGIAGLVKLALNELGYS